MNTEITAIGNAGFLIEAGPARILVDAFYHPLPWVGTPPSRQVAKMETANLILVTHDHPDHFHDGEIAVLVKRTKATVVGPARVIARLQGKVGAAPLVELEPPEGKGKSPAATRTAELPLARITAYRTFHAAGHNSYLVEAPGCRFFHDGDNENTRRIDPSGLTNLDALFIGPWQGAAWAEFIEALQPRRWFLMHLNAEELDQQAAGQFLPDLCDHVPLPDRLVVLRPGEFYRLPENKDHE